MILDELRKFVLLKR